MGSMSIWHWIIVGGVALVLFGGKGKISDLMGDFAKGIKSFKKGMADDETDVVRKPDAPVARPLENQATVTVEKTADPRKV